MSRTLLSLAGLAAVAGALCVGLVAPGGAEAHPLGNFTVNRYDRIDLGASGIEVFSVLDMAEIPAFQEMARVDTDGDGEVSALEADRYGADKAAGLASNLVLVVDGERRALTEVQRTLAFPEGQGGLRTLRLEVTLRADAPEEGDGERRVAFENKNDDGRLGWREIVVRGGAGIRINGEAAPDIDVSAGLTAYPQDRLSSPLDERSANFSFEPGAGIAPTMEDEREARAVEGNPDSTLARFAGLVAGEHAGVGAVALAMLAAMGFGALHALSPGHGKTVVAAYLVGSRGSLRHALLLGVTVTATHTASVYALGLVTLYLSGYVLPEQLYPWLSVASGLLIAAMGLSLLISRLGSSGLASEAALRSVQAWRPIWRGGVRAISSEAGAVAMARGHARRNAREELAARPHGGGEHRHGGGLAHRHGVPAQDDEPVSWRQLVGLGIFGGLLPCPSAIIVMLSAISLHRVGFGLLLIVGFSAGLALVLTSIGFALVLAGRASHRLPIVERMMARGEHGGTMAFAGRAFPAASAAVVTGAGALIALRAMIDQGLM